jgi:hypothetical protein
MLCGQELMCVQINPCSRMNARMMCVWMRSRAVLTHIGILDTDTMDLRNHPLVTTLGLMMKHSALLSARDFILTHWAIQGLFDRSMDA